MVNNSSIRSEIKDLISTLRSSYNTIENHLAPSAGKAFSVFGGFLPGAGTAIFASAVNTIRPVGSKLSSCADKLERLSREIEELENSLENWKNKYNDLRDDNEREKIDHKTIKGDLGREQINSAQIKTKLDNANKNSTELKRQLQDKDEQLTQKNNEIRRIEGEVAGLRLEHGREMNEKNNQLSEKERELRIKNEEIELLQNQKGLTQEGLLTEKLRFERRNLELFANELRINLEQIQSLIRYHERLFQVRKNLNHADIITHQDNVIQAKQVLLNQGVGMISIQEICEKCERIAQLSWELIQLQEQQYQAQQEVPTN